MPEQIMHSFIEGNLSYPQVSPGIVCLIAHTAVDNIVQGNYTWAEYEAFRPSREQVTHLGEVMDRVHRRDGIPVRMRGTKEPGFKGYRVSRPQLEGTVRKFRNMSGVAVGDFAQRVLQSRDPERFASKNYGTSLSNLDKRVLFAREIFPVNGDEPMPAEGLAASVMLGAVARNLKPSNPVAREVKQELRSAFIDQQRALRERKHELGVDALQRRGLALQTMRDIITSSIVDRSDEIEAALGYELPERPFDGFIATVMDSARARRPIG